MDSMAKGRSAVKELADATAVAVIRPVHRPTSRASVFVGIYPILFSSKNLYPCVRLSLLSRQERFGCTLTQKREQTGLSKQWRFRWLDQASRQYNDRQVLILSRSWGLPWVPVITGPYSRL